MDRIPLYENHKKNMKIIVRYIVLTTLPYILYSLLYDIILQTTY